MYYFSLSLKKLSITLLFLVGALSSLSINAATEETGITEALSKISGVYVGIDYPKDPYVISVHVNGDTIGVIDISDNLAFLGLMSYISSEEYQQGIKLSTVERTFIGQSHIYFDDPPFVSVSVSLKPLLPEGLERLKKYCSIPPSLWYPCNSLLPLTFVIDQATSKVMAAFINNQTVELFHFDFIKVF